VRTLHTDETCVLTFARPGDICRRRVTTDAACCNFAVKPRAIDFVLHQCRDLFERKDGKIVARNDQRDPNDPCSPLTFRRWLEDCRSEWPEVFAS